MVLEGAGTSRPANPVEGMYPIRTVSRMTGVNAVTLRAWERRYGLIRPKRTDSGHRLYSEGQINEIRRVVELVESGMSIGQVSTFLRAEGATRGTERREDAWIALRRRLIVAVQSFDEQRVDHVYNESMALYPVDVVTTKLVVPVLHELGERWRDGRGTVAEEHFFSGHLRNKLGARLHHHASRSTGRRLVLACLQGEHHEIGCLLFALSALDRGFRLIYLGADVPLDDLPGVQSKTRSAGIVLAGAIAPTDYDLGERLGELVSKLDVSVLVGGRVCSHARAAIERSGSVLLGSDIGSAMKAIDFHIGSEPDHHAPGL